MISNSPPGLHHPFPWIIFLSLSYTISESILLTGYITLTITFILIGTKGFGKGSLLEEGSGLLSLLWREPGNGTGTLSIGQGDIGATINKKGQDFKGHLGIPIPGSSSSMNGGLTSDIFPDIDEILSDSRRVQEYLECI